jgi:signal peptidase
MAPDIPPVSLAIVRQIPAEDARIGQVVTVDRPGLLPVTHRIVGSHAGPDGTTVLTLKGDANATADPAPYTVRSVRLVLLAMPELAYVIVWLSNPVVLGVLTIAVSTLIAWVLWPRGESTSGGSHVRARGAG